MSTTSTRLDGLVMAADGHRCEPIQVRGERASPGHVRRTTLHSRPAHRLLASPPSHCAAKASPPAAAQYILTIVNLPPRALWSTVLRLPMPPSRFFSNARPRHSPMGRLGWARSAMPECSKALSLSATQDSICPLGYRGKYVPGGRCWGGKS
eukprot:CAMPEP_0181225664 /NCGR_PEP_ID=MMETSP1096-20121128/31825_1 /TAXON_ID=156174 ORGANISM="Chrysochromulina ericina, Strain CCMP281" /NCGR_SAMPLE_ID=MMETSP1096 /ASSEMBLY_ACC=CAM_ASM_000453 /LENGTH=151 /DNA_ID=CAMNT_0023318917 /DNA_START=263 /DNA_END=718 /DNA_ORIENTATION=-